jgi:RNA methyltransferase, TrmH family
MSTPFPVIESLTNPKVKAARALREKKHRREAGLFLAEGLRICTEAREIGRLPEQLFLSAAGMAHPLAAALADACNTAGSELFLTSDAVLSKLSGKDNPQSVIGIYREHATPLADLDRGAAPIWLVAQAMRDPGNLGTLLRTGDAVGAGGVILIDDCVDPFSVETVRASMGAIFTQAIVQTRWDDFIRWMRSGPGALIATSLAAGTVDYRTAAYPAPAFILIGNEARGLPSTYEAEADVRVSLPMRGKADSLNAAVAAAIMAYKVLDWQEQQG